MVIKIMEEAQNIHLTPLEKFIAWVTTAAGVIQQASNLDPSKDAHHEAHLETAKNHQEKQPQEPPKQPNLIDSVINWVTKK